MYKKDYILRMIEMMGELIAGILGLIKKGDFQQASQSLENAYIEFLKEDTSLFRNLPKEKMTDKLINEHNYTNSHLEILAGLFYAEAELSFAKGNQNASLEFYEKALILYEFVAKESKTFFVDKQSKITYIQERITELKQAGTSQ
jgi:hypothetical protein